MTLWKTDHYTNAPKASGWYLDLIALAGIAAAPGLLFKWLFPMPFVPPAICVVSFLMAAVFAWFAHYTGADRRSAAITAWDVAGIFAVLWIGAGLASDHRHLVQFLEILARAS